MHKSWIDKQRFYYQVSFGVKIQCLLKIAKKFKSRQKAESLLLVVVELFKIRIIQVILMVKEQHYKEERAGVILGSDLISTLLMPILQRWRHFSGILLNNF